jgi:hypothetical protein
MEKNLYIVTVLVTYGNYAYENHCIIPAETKEQAIEKVNNSMLQLPFPEQTGYQILDIHPFIVLDKYPAWIYNFSELVSSPNYNSD